MSASSDEPLSTTAAWDSFAEVVNRAAYGKERVVRTRRGKPLVAVVPIQDVEVLEGLEDAYDSALVRERLAEWEAAKPSWTISVSAVSKSARPRLELSRHSRPQSSASGPAALAPIRRRPQRAVGAQSCFWAST